MTKNLIPLAGGRLVAAGVLLALGVGAVGASARASSPAERMPLQPDSMNLDNPGMDPFFPQIPIGPWHELWPDFCTSWDCTDWLDNGNGRLDYCDSIELSNPDHDPAWWHVENVTLTVLFDMVDPPYVPPIYLDWPGPLPPEPGLFDPIGPWHEVFPTYCQTWECVDWADTNLNGVVDLCDWLCFFDPVGLPVCMHVNQIATDVEVVPQEPPPPTKHLDGPAFPPFDPVTDPVGPWHELWPNYCTPWDVTDWVDNGTGVLDFCDYIELSDPFMTSTWWHVENVTLTVFFDMVDPPYTEPIYMDYQGPVPPDPGLFDPIGPWHEIYPNYCQAWECIDWVDTNGDAVVDFCDWLCFLDPAGGPIVCMHVAALSPDIEVVQGAPPCPWDLSGNGSVDFADLLVVLGAWGPCPGLPCPADFDNSGDVGFADLLILLGRWGPCPA